MSYTKGISTGTLSVSHSSALTSNFAINGANINANKCWHPTVADANPCVTASVPVGIAEFASIELQGRADADQWITSFTLKYTKDGINWLDYNNSTPIQTGLTDRNTPKTITLNPPIKAKSIQLYPTTFNGFKVLRWEVEYKDLIRQNISNFEYGIFSTRDGNFPKLYDGTVGDRRYEAPVTFKTGFVKPPFVTVCIHNMSFSKTGSDFRFSTIPHDVTEDGFTCLIRAWSAAQLEEVSFHWIAFEISP